MTGRRGGPERRPSLLVLFLFAITIALTPLCFLVGWQAHSALREAERKRFEVAQAAVRLALAPLEPHFNTPLRVANFIAPLSDLKADACAEVMETMVAQSERIVSSALLDERGRITCGAGPLPEAMPLEAASREPVVWLEPWGGISRLAPRAGGGWTFTAIPAPVFREPLPRDVEKIVILTLDGAILGAHGPGDALAAPAEYAALLAAPDPEPDVPLGAQGMMRVPLIPGEVIALAELSQDALLRSRSALRLQAWLLPVLTLAVSAFLAWLLSRRLVLSDIRSVSEDMSRFIRDRTLAPAAAGPLTTREGEQMRRDFADVALYLAQEEAQLADALRHQDALLREVYHRVGNNFQIILSSINMARRYTESAEARERLARMYDRVRGMSVVHQLQQEAESDGRMRVDRVIETLVARVESDHVSTKNLQITCHLEPLEMSLKAAAPFSYLVSECLANCVDALPLTGTQDEPPYVTITLAAAAPRHAILVIVNGPFETPPDLEAAGAGRRLIDGFVRELSGTASYAVNGNAVRFEAFFEIDAARHPDAGT